MLLPLLLSAIELGLVMLFMMSVSMVTAASRLLPRLLLEPTP